jgi:hypothetical protein
MLLSALVNGNDRVTVSRLQLIPMFVLAKAYKYVAPLSQPGFGDTDLNMDVDRAKPGSEVSCWRESDEH